jgi:hypothetical protein
MSKKDSGFNVNDKSEITIPLKNLIALLLFVGVAITGYFNLVGRITFIEHNMSMQDMHIKSNNEFRIKWPRGELGALPDDAEQNMRLTYIENRIVELHKQLKSMKPKHIQIP